MKLNTKLRDDMDNQNKTGTRRLITTTFFAILASMVWLCPVNAAELNQDPAGQPQQTVAFVADDPEPSSESETTLTETDTDGSVDETRYLTVSQGSSDNLVYSFTPRIEWAISAGVLGTTTVENDHLYYTPPDDDVESDQLEITYTEGGTTYNVTYIITITPQSSTVTATNTNTDT